MALHVTEAYSCHRSCYASEPNVRSSIFEITNSDAIDRCELTEQISDTMKALGTMQSFPSTLKKISLSFIEDVQCTDRHTNMIFIFTTIETSEKRSFSSQVDVVLPC